MQQNENTKYRKVKQTGHVIRKRTSPGFHTFFKTKVWIYSKCILNVDVDLEREMKVYAHLAGYLAEETNCYQTMLI